MLKNKKIKVNIINKIVHDIGDIWGIKKYLKI